MLNLFSIRTRKNTNAMKRLIYLFYYLSNLNYKRFLRFTRFTQKFTGRSILSIWLSVINDSLRYNVSLMEYFLFRFWEKGDQEKELWAGTGYMFEYQLIMNPKSNRSILDDKREFFKSYQRFISHGVFSLIEIEKGRTDISVLWDEEEIVLKKSNGKAANGIEFIRSEEFDIIQLIAYMKSKGYDIAESYINQHKDMDRLSPSGVNTVRIFTQIASNGNVEFLGCRQRISINSKVDNLAAGNVAAEIDEDTGIIIGPGYYSDIDKEPVTKHPVTGIQIIGFQIPFWEEIKDLVTQAALERKENRSIGWDVVLTRKGPSLIEGNHDWCKLVWQLPVNKGLKPVLDHHLSMTNGRVFR